MPLFLLRRFAGGVVLIVMVTAATAMLIFAGGADIAQNIAGENAPPEQVEALAEELGLDRPALVQYADWLRSAVGGDFGRSFVTNQPVAQALTDRLPATLSILLLAVLLTALLSVALGTIAALRRGWVDRLVQVFNVVASALPTFWVGLILVLVFSINLGWLPATGFTPITQDPRAWLAGLVLPVIALVIGSLGTAAIVRSSIIDVSRMDFVRTLRAHGLSPREVLIRHIFRNAAPPFLAIMSMQVIALFGGAVIIERVFAIPGLGTLANSSAQAGDVPMVLGVVAVTVIVIVIVNLLLDLVTGWLNPKVRV
ncbi:MAG: ABC transporter permease [Mycetocola sp.]